MTNKSKVAAPEVACDVPPWHCMTKEEVIKELGCVLDVRKVGLTTAEAEARLARYGENKLAEQDKITLLERIWHHVNNMLVGILVFVAIISAISALARIGNTLQNWIQVVIIIGVIV
jgi:P-type Ca2+ transporter type 2C